MKKQLQLKKTPILALRSAGKFLLLAAILLLGNFALKAQTTYPKDFKVWDLVAEDHQVMAEVTVKVTQCTKSSPASVFVKIFNEKPDADVIDFDLTITNPSTSASFVKSISYSAKAAEMVMPSCENQIKGLVIALPAGYDPAHVTFSVVFK